MTRRTEVQCSKNYFKIFVSQKVGAFGNNIERNSKSHAQNWIYIYIYIYIYIINIYWLLFLQSNLSGSFLKTFINLVEHPHKFYPFQGSIIRSLTNSAIIFEWMLHRILISIHWLFIYLILLTLIVIQHTLITSLLYWFLQFTIVHVYRFYK